LAPLRFGPTEDKTNQSSRLKGSIGLDSVIDINRRGKQEVED
jgi:hypothetical protein